MDVVLPQLRASSLKHVIYNHSVLIIRDVSLQPAESTMQLELMLGTKKLLTVLTAKRFFLFLLCDSFQGGRVLYFFFRWWSMALHN